MVRMKRRLPIGAEPGPDGVHFRVWAPGRRRVAVVPEGRDAIELAPEPDGYFAGLAAGLRPGARYRFQLDDEDGLYPDPASRYQPEGPHGPSQVVDPAGFRWSDAGWRGVGLEGQVIYELHVGTFTPEGTFAAAMRELGELAALGITVIEIMPVADFPGRFGWGYDGVNLFAPTRLYGEPDDLRRFVDHAHGVGLAVILDVVYNHIGPDGNYLPGFSPAYFSDRHRGEWGDPINYDGPDAGPVRELFVANAGYWIDEFHFDGLRLDATQGIFDASPEHILAAVNRRVREAAGGRATIIVAEDETQRAQLVRSPDEGGYGLDAVWNDDFHHCAKVAITGRRDAYLSDTKGTPQELLSAIKHGFLFQGQRYAWQDQPRGNPALDLRASQFVLYIENHDQIANATSHGSRVDDLASAGRVRAMTALLLLAPGTPMLFQGQEFAASSPFCYFADHVPDLAAKVREGRAEFMKQFPRTRACAELSELPDPSDPATFEQCKLDLGERERGRHAETYALHRDLLRMRREDPVFAAQRGWPGLDGSVLAPEAFALRFFGDGGADRVLIVNLGGDLAPESIAEPLLAPPAGQTWELRWSSEHPRYGGCGTPPVVTDAGWRILGHAAVVLAPRDRRR